MTTRLEVLGDDGEWHQVPGVVSVQLDEEQPENQRDADYRRHDALDALVYATPDLADTVEITITPRLTGFREACARAEESMRRLDKQHPRVIDQEGNPVRPAWQSPYGPPRRHS
ncbi:hypothetical protein [Streptomyces bobili]|uniref:hypothetical protein n=1 Tax=Streptomyces bobili TaxID=67280 RepID=UPI00379498AD